MKTAGVDVGKARLDIAIYGERTVFSVANASAGWAELIQELKARGVGEVGLEASGGYEREAAEALRAAGFTVIRLQPSQVRAFARAQLQRAKNDRLDAVLIAAFTAILGGRAHQPDPRLTALADGLVFLEQVEDDLVRAKTRLEHQRDPRLRRLIEADIRRATTRRAQEIRRLIGRLRQADDLARRFDLLLSLPGIGERTALTLVIAMPELGRLSREEAAALAGLAPFDDDSGERQGTRSIQGGRARVRTALYAAAVPAAHRWNPALIALYKRLIAKGKKPKMAFVACARKLLTFANAVLARGTPWQPQATIA
jgi:transposase